AHRKKMRQHVGAWSSAIVGISLLNSLLIAYVAIEHLPFIDFRVYKIGNNIRQLRKAQAPCRYEYVLEKDGKQFIFEQYPSDTSYRFKEMRLLNEKECSPKITDYYVSGPDGTNYTEESLTGKKLFVIVHRVEKTEKSSFEKIKKLIEELASTDITVVVLTADAVNFEDFRRQVGLEVPYYIVDGVVLKTMMRSDPGLMYVEDGTVKGKWHYNDVPEGIKIKNNSFEHKDLFD
ncbi:MAG: DoxX family protein, partial [Flammeovirgaceae bacterium]|nr:DoxX family protein [Flammeovirgaceae bacterium]